MSAFRIECPKCGATWAMPDQYPVDHIEFCPECQTAFDPRNAPAPTQPVPVLDAVKPKKRMIAMIAGGGIALLVLVGVVIRINVAGSDANVAKDDAATKTTTDTATTGGNGIKSSASQTDAKIFGPSVPFARQVSYAPSTGGLTYSWPEGVKQVCKFEYEIEVGNVIHGLSGQVDYEPTRTSPSSVISAAEPEGGDEGSGSAFVVRPDGYLVTCAHVVMGAVDTKVQLGNRTYAAKVVDLDVPNDLALLRIAADKLPYLTIFDSDNVRLAEDVRAIGYPLSDILGESITVSRGTVSAIVRQEGESLLQLDARVNPGNSGGPIVNEKGQLVGVASAMIAGEEIASIGFAVLSNKVRGLLEKQELRYRMADSSVTAFAGPDLAARVTPAVALVKVKLGPGGVGIAEEKVIRFSGIWNGYLRSKTSTAKRAVGSARESGVVLVDSKGQISFCDGTKSLPAFAGLVGLVGIVPLPDDGEDEWQLGRMEIVPQTKTTTTNPLDPSSLSPYRSPHRNRYTRPGPTVAPKTQKSLVLHPAIETANFKITSTSGNTLMIKKSYEMKTLHDAGEPVYFHSKGTGSIQFDKKRGIPLAQVYLGQLKMGSQGPLPVRMKLTYSLSDGSSPPVVVKVPPPMVNPDVKPVPDRNTPPVKLQQLTARSVGSPKYFDGHTKAVWKTAYSRDGKLVASSGDDQSIRIWDIGEQNQLHMIEGDGKLVGAIAISPDGKQLASGHYGEKVRLWDVASGRLLKAFTAENDRANIDDVSYSPTGKRLVACSGHGTIAVYDVVEQSVVTEFHLGRLNVRKVEFLPGEDRILIAGTHPPFVELWDVESRRRIRSFEVESASKGTSAVMAVRADGAEMAFCVSTSHIYRWDVESGEPLTPIPSGSPLNDLEYSPNIGYLVAHGNFESRIFDIEAAQPVVRFPRFTRAIQGLWLSADGQRIKLSGQSVKGGQEILAITEFALPADPSRQ